MKNIIILTLFLASCGRASDVYVNQDSQAQQQQQTQSCEPGTMHGTVKYQYKYSTGSCTTGCHYAQSPKDFCAQLGDDALNNYCAKDERQQAAYNAKCGD